MRVVVVVAAAFAVSSCAVSPSNPCDPAASPELQRQGTRLGGRVVDTDGNGVTGVTVSVLGLSATAVSGDDGAWSVVDVPPSADGYTVRAEPLAPTAGGTRVVPSLGCQEQLDDVDVVVVAPLDAPAVELVRAITATSLLVAFGSGDAQGAELPRDDSVGGAGDFYDDGGGFRDVSSVADTCAVKADIAARAWRVQVRPPFEGWHDAVINAFPWIDGAAAVGAGVDALAADRTEDFCGAAVCQQFSYLDPSLADPRARCANVVGFKDGDDVKPLQPFGSYEVRVLTERRLDDDLRAQFALPARVASAAPAGGLQTSLVPSTLLPVVDGAGAPLDARDLGVTSVVATAGGRFALVEPDGLRVVGGGGDVLRGNNGEVAAGAPQDAAAFDGVTNDAVAADFLDDGEAEGEAFLALPAGDWLRVVKESDVGAVVEKVYVGVDAAAGADGPGAAEAALVDAAEARVPLAPSGTSLGALRAMSYLDPGVVRLSQEAANPQDAYLLLYAHGFVLVENGRSGQLALQSFVAADNDAGGFDTDYDDSDDGDGFGGDCAGVVGFDGDAFGANVAANDANGDGRTEVAVCYDVAAATDVDVNFTDAAVLDRGVGAVPIHVIADRRNDRVVAVGRDALAGNAGPLRGALQDVPVGREPVAVTTSSLLACADAEAKEAVVLVANAGSADVSVVTADDGVAREAAVIALPAAPAGFVDDIDGPSCDEPFIWVIAADGRLFPVDMSRLEVPSCGAGACQISSRGRARSGATAHVERRVDGVTARSLVGGAGLVAELGFFRPAALSGGAFNGGDFDVAVEPAE